MRVRRLAGETKLRSTCSVAAILGIGANLGTHNIIHQQLQWLYGSLKEIHGMLFILGKSCAFVLIQCRRLGIAVQHFATAVTEDHPFHLSRNTPNRKIPKRSGYVGIISNSSIDSTRSQSSSSGAPSITSLQVVQPCQQPAH